MATMGIMNDSFSQSELAAMFGVQTASIRRWWAQGLLPPPFKTPGGNFRWLKSDIELWLKANREKQESFKETAQ